ncbi:uncharacterized protein BX663DRAFT_546534 [Cokeromyces recurvatus]|uniref:uncharacterized protein n=1 Tax=Cokeromyces recurvatus TaxID=90255 RepID=UPI00221F4227|nr:uncharacterized protein BX663DRAFT_546534 [Cokeromyces recurvatus]KAI7898320.1 hypothetical protein BX663DRAFT_546534 [Cokeromyces recurvatus]
MASFPAERKIPETVASKAYVHRKLKELQFAASLNRRKFESLKEAVLSSINGNAPLIFGKKLQSIQEHKPMVSTFGLSSYIRNVIYANGYSVSCLFSRITEKDNIDSPPVRPSDLKKDIDNGCQVWAVDPGISTVFTIVDQTGRVRSFSQEEYYHLCGFNDAAHIRKIHQPKHAETHKMITELDSLKPEKFQNS